MERFFIRTKDQEGFVESEDLQSAFVQFVKETPLELLGAILIGHTEYFPAGENSIPEDARAIRVTIPLVKAGIWTEEQAKDFNESFMGERIV